MAADDPYGDFQDDDVPSNLMTVLIQLADEQEAAEAEVARIEAELETAKDQLKEITENRLPNAAEGISGKLKLTDGRTIEIGEKIRASIAGDKRVPAIKWLDDNDYGHIVKRQVIFEFAKDDKTHDKFMEAVKASGLPLNMRPNYSVHHATLEAFVREKLGEGVELPKDTFGIYRQRFSKIKGE
jgi:hypothetical protein